MPEKVFFEATSKNLITLLCDQAFALAIPPYQRPFSWEPDQQVKTLFYDICDAFYESAEKAVTRNFIGTIITTRCPTVGKQDGLRIPKGAVAIIDGQQRMTTLLLIMGTLHEKLVSIFKSNIKELEDLKASDLIYVLEETIGKLQACLFETIESYAGAEKVYSPRITRLYIDVWNGNNGIYESPIAKYISNYCAFITKGLGKKQTLPDAEEFNFNLDFLNTEEDKKLKVVLEYLRKQLSKYDKEIIKPPLDEDEAQVPRFEKFIGNKEFFKELFTVGPEAILKLTYTNKDNEPKTNEENLETSQSPIKSAIPPDIKRLLILSGLARYMYSNVYITYVNSADDELAFNIFESLNTTGLPLTALETFKPRVYQGINLEQEELTDSKPYQEMESITSIVENLTQNDQKGEKDKPSKLAFTQDLLITFAYEEVGQRISKKIASQRAFLRTYDKLKDQESKFQSEKQKEFVWNLLIAVKFYGYFWTGEIKNKAPKIAAIPSIEASEVNEAEKQELISQLSLCLSFLYQLRHTIVLSLFIRYYANYQKILASTGKADPFSPQAVATLKEFINVVKACTAFSALWRAPFSSTSQIDGAYRRILKEGVSLVSEIKEFEKNEKLQNNKDKKQNKKFKVLGKKSTSEGRIGFCRLDEKQNPNIIPSLEDLKLLLRTLLLNKVGSKESWVERTSQASVYSYNKTLTKFLILAASHNSCPSKDPKKKGTLQRCLTTGNSSPNNVLNFTTWTAEDVYTIEHIAPQSPLGTKWDTEEYREIYEPSNKALVHTLGNLILLPSLTNALLSNNDPDFKQKFFKILSLPTLDEVKQSLQSGEMKDIKLSENAIKYLQNNRSYLNLINSIAEYDDPWNADFIKRRGISIAERAWDNLYSWLT